VIGQLEAVSRNLKELATGSYDDNGYDLDMVHQRLVNAMMDGHPVAQNWDTEPARGSWLETWVRVPSVELGFHDGTRPHSVAVSGVGSLRKMNRRAVTKVNHIK